jgi:SAM-dependent methyltransferase
VTQTAAPRPGPGRILDLSWGIARTGTLVAALDLDLFTRVADGYRTAPVLARVTGAAEPGVDALLTALAGLGLLTRAEDGTVELAEDAAAHLVRGLPGYLGDLRHMHHTLNFRLWPRLAEAIQAGRPLDEIFADDGSAVWERVTPYLDALSEAAERWLAGALADRLGDAPRVLDVGCGSGGYGRAVARRFPGARVLGLDREDVARLAASRANEAGLGDELTYRGGDVRDLDWGTGHEAVLLCNLLHGYPEDVCRAVLGRARQALAPGGCVAIFEIVPDVEQPMANPVAAFFTLQMLMTSRGRAHSVSDYGRWLGEAGFTGLRAERCPAGPHTLLSAIA